jgi:hypothetical protein
MKKLGYVLLTGMAWTLAGCGAGDAEDLGSTQEASVFPQSTYWRVGTVTNGGATRGAACNGGDIMLGLSLGNSTDPPLIKCGVVSVALDTLHKYNGISTRSGINPSCSGSSGYTDVARSWSISYPAFSTTLGCAPGNAPYSYSSLYVDDLQGQGWFTYNGKSRFQHICSQVGSFAIGYNGDHDQLLCAN